MTIIRDDTNLTSYKADGLGATKPKILIGGKTEKFVPNMNLSFECESGSEKFFINFNRKGNVVDKEVSIFTDNEVKLTIGQESDIFKISPDGTLKWDIEYLVKPDNLIPEWDILSSSGISFFYQPPLTPDEILDGNVRPAKVEGSYAVYCNKANRLIDSKGQVIHDYGAGKLCHIYRPVCIDADGEKEWAELNIDNGIMRISLPKQFMDTATYPVRLDPEFGYTDVGATKNSQNNYCRVNLLAAHTTADGTGTLTAVLVYYDPAANGTISAGVYDDTTDDGTPDALIDTGDFSIGSADATEWKSITMDDGDTITSGSRYYPIGYSAVSPGYFYYDSAEAMDGVRQNVDTPPNPYGASYYDIERLYSLKIEYTAAGGGTSMLLVANSLGGNTLGGNCNLM